MFFKNMEKKSSAFSSRFIIDGVPQGPTPADMLLPLEGLKPSSESLDEIIDESTDLAPSAYKFSAAHISDYLAAVNAFKEGRSMPVQFTDSLTKGRIAAALIETIWRTGEFTLEDLSLFLSWKWDESPVGNMAALYHSVEAAAEYIDALGLPVSGHEYSPEEGGCRFSALASGAPEGRKCPSKALAAPSDWVIYVPFDTCEFRLGGSRLSEGVNARSCVAPDISDAAYFTDCYELVRELVSDGIVRSGITVSEGGLMKALSDMIPDGCGISADITGIMRAYEEFPVRVLFSEIPGVILTFRDSDFDYIDAEFILQDVAYYPLGHIDPGKDGISVITLSQQPLSGILGSILDHHALEGED